MAMLRFLFRRLVAQRLLALGVVLTLAFSVGVMASGPIYTDAARDFILASSIATAGTPIKNVRVDVYGDPSFDWMAADRQVRAASSVLPVDTIVIMRAFAKARGKPQWTRVDSRCGVRDGRVVGVALTPDVKPKIVR